MSAQDFNDLFGSQDVIIPDVPQTQIGESQEETLSFMPQKTTDYYEKEALQRAAKENEGIMAELFGDDTGEQDELDGDTMQDLFGSDLEDEDMEQVTEVPPSAPSRMEQEFMQVPPPTAQTQKRVFRRICPEGERIEMQINKMDRPQGDEIQVFRMPNVVALEPDNFDASNYVAPTHTDKSTFVRWRIVYDPKNPNQFYKESNSRLVTWSDGSRSLVIGKEYFDVTETSLRAGEHFLYATSKRVDGGENGPLLAHGQIMSKCHVETVNKGGLMAEMSQSVVAKKFLRANKSQQISVGQNIAMMYEQRSRTGMNDAHAKANRKRKRAAQRQERVKQRKMTQEFLETGADEINPEEMNDSTDEEDFSIVRKGPISRNEVNKKMASMIRKPIESSDSEDEPLTSLTARSRQKIIDDSEDDS